MKRITIFGIIFVLLAVAVVPVMAKSPAHGNGKGNGNGNGVKLTTPVPSSLPNSTGVDTATHPNNGRGRDKTNWGVGNSLSKNNGAQNQSRKSTPFYLQGIISAVDPVSETITVTLTHGNAQVKQFIGAELTIQGGNAVVYQLTQGNDDDEDIGQATVPSVSSIAGETNENDDEGNPAKIVIPFADLEDFIGNKVAIHGRVMEDKYVAALITVYISEPVGEPGGG